MTTNAICIEKFSRYLDHIPVPKLSSIFKICKLWDCEHDREMFDKQMSKHGQIPVIVTDSLPTRCKNESIFLGFTFDTYGLSKVTCGYWSKETNIALECLGSGEPYIIIFNHILEEDSPRLPSFLNYPKNKFRATSAKEHCVSIEDFAFEHSVPAYYWPYVGFPESNDRASELFELAPIKTWREAKEKIAEHTGIDLSEKGGLIDHLSAHLFIGNEGLPNILINVEL